MPERYSTKSFIKYKLVGTQYEGRGYIDNMLRVFDSNIKNKSIRNLIDIGCADGYKTSLYANNFDISFSQVVGLDIDIDYLYQNKYNFNVVKFDLEKISLPFKDNAFDLLICNQVLEHLVNYKAVLDEIIKITKPGGFVAVGIPNLAHFINRLYLLFGYQPLSIDLKGSHINGFTHRAFKELLDSRNDAHLIDYKGEIMYPFPRFLAKFFSKFLIGWTGYISYLLQKVKT